MALTSDQISSLLSQGAITAAQAQALSSQSQPMQSTTDQNASYDPSVSSQQPDQSQQSQQSQQSLAPGQTTAGNIDLTTRPVVQNPDGSVSTVRSISANIDGQEVLIPTVSNDGRVMSNDEAIQQYKQSGQHLGKFADIPSANAYAQQLHQDQAKLYESSIPVNAGAPYQTYQQKAAAAQAAGQPVPSPTFQGGVGQPSTGLPPAGPPTPTYQQMLEDSGARAAANANPSTPAMAKYTPHGDTSPQASTSTANSTSNTTPTLSKPPSTATNAAAMQQPQGARILMPAQAQPNYGEGQPLPDTDLGTGPERSIGALQPEKTLLDTSNRLGYEQRSQLEEQKKQQAQINQMQYVANDTAASMAQKNAEALMKEQAENRASWQAAMNKADKQSADIIARARATISRGVDPNHYWNSMDTAGQFFAGFSLSLGAMGAALLHTQNFAMEKMKMAVANDIDAQKTNISNAYKSLDIEESVHHSDLQRAQIDAAYRDKSAMEHWESGKLQIQALTARMQDPIDKQKADMLLGNIDNEIRQNKLGMAQNLYNFETLQRKQQGGGTGGPNPQKVRDYITDKTVEFMDKFGYDRTQAEDLAVQEAATKFNLPSTGGGNVFPGKQPKGEDSTNVKIPLISPDGTPVIKDGQVVYTAGKAVNSTAAKEITEGGALEANAKIVDLTNRLIKMREDHAGILPGKTGGTWSPEERATAERISGELKAAVLKAEGLNRYTKEDNEHVVAAQVPESPLEMNFSGIIGSDPTAAKLKDLNAAAKRRAVALTRGGMVTPVFGKSNQDVAKETGGVE